MSNRVGIAGTGLIARQVARCVSMARTGLELTRVLTRRPLDSVEGMDSALLTNDLDDLLERCDIVFECTGDAIHGTEVVDRALSAGRRVVTMNSELHVTTGSAFVGRGYFTESAGDQPGCFAELRAEAEEMGFDVRAFVNIKGFLNLDPPESDMRYWSEKQELALEQTVSFTDGTKIQIEQAFVANGLGADLLQEGLVGGDVVDIADTDYLGDVSDYVVCPSAPPGVLVLASHEVGDALVGYRAYSRIKTRAGKYFVLVRPFHLCALEVVKSLHAAQQGRPILLDNGKTPRYGVAAVAKRAVAAGQPVSHALGSFEFRGTAVSIAERPDHVPICLIRNARFVREVAPGQMVTFGDVELPESKALDFYRAIRQRVLRAAAAA